LLGTTGRIRGTDMPTEWELWQQVPQEQGRPQSARIPFPLPLNAEAHNLGAIRDILRAVETGVEPSVTGRHAAHALEIAIAFRESERRGERVELPLPDDSLAMHVQDLSSRKRAKARERRS